MNVIPQFDTPHVRALSILAIGVVVGLLTHAMLFAALRRIVGRTPTGAATAAGGDGFLGVTWQDTRGPTGNDSSASR